MVSKEEVIKLAKLAKLDVAGEEERMAGLLSDTLDYIKVLNELDTSDVEETYQVTGLTNIFQKRDEYNATLSKENVVKNGSHVVDGLFGTKAVLER